MDTSRRSFLSQACAAASGAACWPLTSGAHQPHLPPPQARQLESYFLRIYAEGLKRESFRFNYPGGFQSWQARARPQLQRLIGLDAISQQSTPHEIQVQLDAPEERGGYSIRRGAIATEPDVTIPFWLLRPEGDGPFPLAILPHGHRSNGHAIYAGVYSKDAERDESLASDSDVAVQAVRHGFVAIAPAVRGLAKVVNVPDEHRRHGERDCRSHFMHCILAGRTAVGERVWDMSRLIDWSSTLPEVDPRTVLMMGNSGGGVVTMYAAACDERITIAVPSCAFSVIASPGGRIYHCDCCAVPGILNWGDLYDVNGLIAPRWLLAVNGRQDQLHAAADVNRSAQRVQAIYQASGHAERFAHAWGPAGHRFYKNLMWPFIMQAIKNA